MHRSMSHNSLKLIYTRDNGRIKPFECQLSQLDKLLSLNLEIIINDFYRYQLETETIVCSNQKLKYVKKIEILIDPLH